MNKKHISPHDNDESAAGARKEGHMGSDNHSSQSHDHQLKTGVPESYISEKGDRIVIETNYIPGADRCQMIFERVGRTGEWVMSLCWPGTPKIRINASQAQQLSYGLRIAPA